MQKSTNKKSAKKSNKKKSKKDKDKSPSKENSSEIEQLENLFISGIGITVYYQNMIIKNQ